MVQYGTKFPGTGAIRTPAPGIIIEFLGTILPTDTPFSFKGTDIITPLLVPIHSRFDEINRHVILTKENPNLPVPKTFACYKHIYNTYTIYTMIYHICIVYNQKKSYLTFY